MKELLESLCSRLQAKDYLQVLPELLELSKEPANREYFATPTTTTVTVTGEGFSSSLLGVILRVVLPKIQDTHETHLVTLLLTLQNVANNPANRKELCNNPEFHLLEVLAHMLTRNINMNAEAIPEITDMVCIPILELLQTLALDEVNKAAIVQMELLLGVLLDMLAQSKARSRNLKNKTGMLLGSLCLHATNRDLMLELPGSILEAMFGVVKECSAETSSNGQIELAKEGSQHAVWALRSFSLSRRISLQFARQKDNLKLLFQAAHGPLSSPKLVEHLIQICMNMALCGAEGVQAMLDAGFLRFLNSILNARTGHHVKKWKSNPKRALLVLLNCACYSTRDTVFRDEFLTQVVIPVLDDTSNSHTAPEVKHCYLLLCIFCGQQGFIPGSADMLCTKYPSLLSVCEDALQVSVSDMCSVGAVTRRKDYIPLRAVLCGLQHLSMHDGTRSSLATAAWLPGSLTKLLALNTDDISADVLSYDADERVCGSEECATAVSLIARFAIDLNDPSKIREYVGGDLLACLERVSSTSAESIGPDTKQLASVVLSLCDSDEPYVESYSFKPQSIFLTSANHSLVAPTDARALLASTVIDLATETNRYVSTDCAFRGASGINRQSLPDTVQEMLSCDYLIFIVSDISQFDSFGRILSKRYLAASKKPRLLMLYEENVQQSSAEWLLRLQEASSNIRSHDNSIFRLSRNSDSWNFLEIVQEVFGQQEEKVTDKATDADADAQARSSQALACVSGVIAVVLQNITSITGNAERNSAASKIQAVQRGTLAKKRVAALKKQEETLGPEILRSQALASVSGSMVQEVIDISENAETNAAAAKLQAIQRCKIAKKNVEEFKPSAEDPLVGADAKGRTELPTILRQTIARTVVGAILDAASQWSAKEAIYREHAAYKFGKQIKALESTVQINAAAKDLEARSLREQLDKMSEENSQLRTKQQDLVEETRVVEPVSNALLFAATPPSRQLKPLNISPRNNANLVESYRDTPASSSSPLSSASRTDVIMFDPLDYIKNPLKCMHPSAMSSLLEEMGITEIAELAVCDASDIHAITMLLKPLPRKLFLKEMSQLRI